MKKHYVLALIAAFASGMIAAPYSAGQTTKAASKVDKHRSLGLYVTLTRLTAVTDSGLTAIPANALVTVVEDDAGQKFAVFRQSKIAINDLSKVSNEAAKIAAATTGKASASSGDVTPGAVMRNENSAAPQANTNEHILVDENGKVISKSKTTTISDGAGNTMTIKQASNGAVAAKLAAARAMIEQQRNAIYDLKDKRTQKLVISNYDTKLKQLTDQLQRMEVEYARMEAQSYQ